MNTFGMSFSCRVCGADLLVAQLTATTAPEIRNVDRQIANGMDDSCQRARYFAAVELMRAADAVRLMDSMGARFTSSPTGGWVAGSPFAKALGRARAAEERCVALKMWPAERSTRRPPWFYGDERSNTE